MSSSTKELLQLYNQSHLKIYKPPELIFKRGQGSLLYDTNGKDYIDLGAGIAVNALGHNNSLIKNALIEQADKLWHLSNLYISEPVCRLVDELTSKTFADKAFLCNSGAEANEAAIKMARKYAYRQGNTEKNQIISFTGSFHGRTMATITATAQPKYQEGFGPLPKGFDYAEFNHFESINSSVNKNTAAIIIEPIQGESGINIASNEFLKHLREICDQNDALLIFDEIQTGMGRTGDLFAYMGQGVTPDILTVAKSFGGGLPIGAMLSSERVASGLQPGDHGTTFGGNPVISHVAHTVLTAIDKPEFYKQIKKSGAFFMEQLKQINQKFGLFKDIRGKGLMIGAELNEQWQSKYTDLLDISLNKGVLVLPAGNFVARFLPALNISDEDITLGLERFSKAIASLA